MVYRYCIVPECQNTTKSTLGKTFITVPKEEDKRDIWLKAMGRNPRDISYKTVAHVCEDHFILQQDMDNYMEWKMMGVMKRLKNDVVPHIFHCQHKKRFQSEQSSVVKRARTVLCEITIKRMSSPKPELSIEDDEIQVIDNRPFVDLTLQNSSEDIATMNDLKLEPQDDIEIKEEALTIEETHICFDMSNYLDQPQLNDEFPDINNDSPNLVQEELKLEDDIENKKEMLPFKEESIDNNDLQRLELEDVVEIRKEALSVDEDCNQSNCATNSVQVQTLNNASTQSEPVSMEEKSSQSDYSLESLLMIIQRTVESKAKNDTTDVSLLFENVELVDACIQNLTSYRTAITRALKLSVNRDLRKRHKWSTTTDDHNLNSPEKSEQGNLIKSSSYNDEKRNNKKRKLQPNEIEAVVAEKNSKPEEQIIPKTRTGNFVEFNNIDANLMFVSSTIIQDELILGTKCGKVLFISCITGLVQHTLNVSTSHITSISYLRAFDHTIYLYVGCSDSRVRVYDLKSKNMISDFDIYEQIVCSDAMWENLFIGCKKGVIMRYSLERKLVRYKCNDETSDILTMKAYREGPRKVLIVGQLYSHILVRDAFSGQLLRSINCQTPSQTVYCLVVSNNLLFCGTAKDHILVYGFRSGKLIQQIVCDIGKGVSCLKVRKGVLFIGSYNGSVYMYDLKTKSILPPFAGPGGGIVCMELLPYQIVVTTISGKFGSILLPNSLLSSNLF